MRFKQNFTTVTLNLTGCPLSLSIKVCFHFILKMLLSGEIQQLRQKSEVLHVRQFRVHNVPKCQTKQQKNYIFPFIFQFFFSFLEVDYLSGITLSSHLPESYCQSSSKNTIKLFFIQQLDKKQPQRCVDGRSGFVKDQHSVKLSVVVVCYSIYQCSWLLTSVSLSRHHRHSHFPTDADRIRLHKYSRTTKNHSNQWNI